MGKKSRLKKLRRLESQVLTTTDSKTQEKNKYLIGSIVSILIITVVVVMIYSLFQDGLPSGHDISAHFLRFKLFDNALRQNQFPVRWIEGLAPGYSEPLFNFYQSGVYYFMSAFHSVIPSLAIAIKLTIFLLWVLGGGFMFLLMKRFGLLPALLSSIIFILTPYILLDIFVRAAYPELGAISFIPAAFWATDRLITNTKIQYAFALGIFLAVIILCHLPTLVIIFPVLLSYMILKLSLQNVTQKSLYLLILGIVIAFGLSSFYTLPAIFEIKYINSELLTSGYYDFHQHFVYLQQIFFTTWDYGISKSGINDGMSFQFGIIQWAIITVSLISLIFLKKEKPYIIFFLLVLGYGIYFMHDLSMPFWEDFKALNFIQYPWRFLLVVPLSTAFLAGILLSKIKDSRYQLGITCFIILSCLIIYQSYLKPSTYLPDNYFVEVQNKDRNTYLEVGYLPREVKENPPENLKIYEVIKGTAQIEAEKITDTQFYLNYKSAENSVIRINSHYFPGWEARIDDSPTQINHQNSFGYMDVAVPNGIHKIIFEFKNTPIRTLGNLLTGLSLISLLLYIIKTITQRLRLI